MKKLRVVLKYARYFGLILLAMFVLALLTELFTQPRPLTAMRLGLEVAVDMLPGMIIVVIIWWLAGRFIYRVYDLKSPWAGVGVLLRRRFGKIGLMPFALLNQGRIVADKNSVATCGGPATLIVHNDTAVVLEKAGKLTRVEGTGFPSMEPFEKIYDIIDLRPKSWNYTVNAMSKEGIPLSWEVEVQYQINNGGQAPTEKMPYPFVKEDVFKAAANKWRREWGRVQDLDWEGRLVIGQTEGSLRAILARRCLDELIGLCETDQLAVRESIQRELEEILRQAAPPLGAKILKVKLGNLKLEDEIIQQWIENWRTHWYTWSTSQLTEEEAVSLHTTEMANAEAQLMPLNLLTQELQELGSSQDITAVILMRLISALAQARFENELFAPKEALDAIKKFQDLLNGNNFRLDDEPVEITAGSSAPPALPQRNLPLLGEIATGQAIPATDDIIGELRQTGELEFEFESQPLTVKRLYKGSQLKFDPEYHYVVVSTTGDSMNRAGIERGDYVILQTSRLSPVRPAAGDIVAVAFRDPDDQAHATLKRIHFETEAVVLQPESTNPIHTPRILPKNAFAGDNPQARVVGIVTAVLSRKNGKAREAAFG